MKSPIFWIYGPPATGKSLLMDKLGVRQSCQINLDAPIKTLIEIIIPEKIKNSSVGQIIYIDDPLYSDAETKIQAISEAFPGMPIYITAQVPPPEGLSCFEFLADSSNASLSL